MADTTEIEGVTGLVARLEAIGDGTLHALAAAVHQRAEAIMADSKEHYAPVDEGILKSSGYVQPPEISGDEVSVVLGYGGAAQAYALEQHERLDHHHRVGSAKYLELPLLAGMAAFLRDIGDGAAAAIEGRGGSLAGLVASGGGEA